MKQIKIPTPKFHGPQVRIPPFLNNLYRDMRDRRLLVPALALLVALIAVPVMLKSSPSSSPPSPQASSGTGEATATEPAVVTRQLGVTNYRKRLGALQSKNPFRKHFTSIPNSAKLTTTSSSVTTSSSTTSSTGATTASSSTAPVEPSTSTTSSTTSSSGSTSPTGSTSQPATHHHHSKPKPFYVKRRIDVKVGPQGSLVEERGVKQLSFLPSGVTPLVAYLGANEAGTRAFFDVSSDVTSVSGGGKCLPSASACDFVVLKRGEVATFDYSPDPGTPYKLKLLAIRNVVTTSLGGRTPQPKRSAGARASARGSATPFD